MTWSDVISTGRGKLRFAVVFEGWPEIWVSDPTITLSDATFGATGRSVRVGLLSDGLRFSERALMREGRFDASPMTFKFRSTTHNDYAAASFARVGRVVDTFNSALTLGTTTIGLFGTLTDGMYHAGTEALYIRTGGTTSRGQWDSQAQGFQVSGADGRDLLHHVYDYPPTLDGRRATLYVWAVGDDVTKYDPAGAESGAGKPIWRGVVNRPPRLDRDCVTWTVTADHVYSLFKQTIGGNDAELRLTGIYHNDAGPIVVRLSCYNNGGTSSISSQDEVSGFAADAQGLATQVNTMLATALAELTTPGVDSLFIEVDDGGNFTLAFVAGASPPRVLTVDIWSPLMGNGFTDNDWYDSSGRAMHQSSLGVVFTAGETYRKPLSREDNGGFAMPEGASAAAGLFGPLPGVWPQNVWGYDRFGITVSTSPVNRLYINQPWSNFVGVDAIAIDPAELLLPATPYKGVNWGAPIEAETAVVLRVTGSGTTSGVSYVDYEAVNGDGSFRGFVTDKTNLRPVYSGGVSVDVMGFVSTLIDDAKAYGNDGTRPFIRDADVDTTEALEGQLPEQLTQRAFVFVKSVRLDDVIAEELKLTAHMWFTTSLGKLGFRPIPMPAETFITTKSIGAGDILTPEGSQGAWPTYEIQSQGICGVITIKQGYDAYTDEWRGAEFVVSDQNVLSTHKKRGVSEITIAPKSNPLTASVIDGDGGISASMARQVASNMFAVFGREYATVKVKVPFSKFSYLIGDVVKFTSPHTPNTDGTRGVTDKRAVVIGREWSLDGKEAHGEIELMLLLNPPKGYSPSGYITAQTNTSGNIWELTLSAANAVNILLSPLGDGDVAGTFAVDDYITIVNRNPGTNYTGRVTAVSGAVVTVSLDAVWTPSTDNWALEYRSDSGSTATDSQREYVYVADGDFRKADNSYASQFE